MKRLIFCPGVCQIISAAAALAQHHGAAAARASEEDVLVLFRRHPDTTAGRAMEEIARAVWPWREIRWAQEVIIWYFPTRRFAPVAREVLNKRFPEVDELWVSKLCMDSTKLVLYAFPDASVTIYEDGAEEFIPQTSTCGKSRWRSLSPWSWPGAVKRELSHWNRRPECMEADGVCARDLARVNIFYSFLSRYLAVPDYLQSVPLVQVPHEVLRERYQVLRETLAGDFCAQPPKGDGERLALFLPQAFATLFLSIEDEHVLYRSAIQRLRAMGYKVLWKDHPQQNERLISRLLEDLGAEALHPLRIKKQLPVECLVGGWDLDAVVSVSSTSLLYLHGLYGYPAATAAGMLAAERWLKETDRKLAELYLRHVPELDQLPEA